MAGKNLTISNTLTIFRLFLGPVILYEILAGSKDIALYLFILGLLTDFFDGFIARRYSSITGFGKMFDPVSDKLMYGFVLFGVLIRHGLFYWIIFFSIAVIAYTAGYIMFVKKDLKVTDTGKAVNSITALITGLMIIGYVNRYILVLFVAVLSIPASIYLKKIFGGNR